MERSLVSEQIVCEQCGGVAWLRVTGVIYRDGTGQREWSCRCGWCKPAPGLPVTKDDGVRAACACAVSFA